MKIPFFPYYQGKIVMSKESKREILGMSMITYKFQVTVPKKVREKHRLKEGDTLAFVEEHGRIYVAKSTEV
ncbi:MAG: AbrB/MazE/SpoVT family DNA-binding domain-containing protein [Thaumarchaeota archaeon]|nr:AbrB/MazE/SpoVT family DNA-binding domain-containing protein [Nitrososphaerota archaeon]MDE1867031.1 AbrB/MazE/SpoVT family DNA-binding domain-containing protein [Nitrososphaerota archaeon]